MVAEQQLLLPPAHVPHSPASGELEWSLQGDTPHILANGAQRTHRRHSQQPARRPAHTAALAEASPQGSGTRFFARPGDNNNDYFGQQAAAQQHRALYASLTAAAAQFMQQTQQASCQGKQQQQQQQWRGGHSRPASDQHLQQHQQQHQAAGTERLDQRREESSSSDPFTSAKLLLAGALSAVVSRTCVAPLERVKMELMLKQGAQGGAWATAVQVLTVEGPRGFWKGNLLNLLRTAPFKAVNFCSFDSLHRALVACTGVDGNMERFLSGALAGVTATIVCFPLDVVRTRLMSRATRAPHYGSGPFRTLAGILRHEGPGALYSGCLPAVMGMAPAGAVFYGVYDALKHRHLQRMRREQHLQQQLQQQHQHQHQQHGEGEERHGGRSSQPAPGAMREGSDQTREGSVSPQPPQLLVSTSTPLLAASAAEAAQRGRGGAPGAGEGTAATSQRAQQQLQRAQHLQQEPQQHHHQNQQQHQHQHQQQHQRLPTAYTLLYGAVAGACSELLVYPLEVIRRRMQMQAMAAAAQASMRAATAAAAAATGAAAATALPAAVSTAAGATAAGMAAAGAAVGGGVAGSAGAAAAAGAGASAAAVSTAIATGSTGVTAAVAAATAVARAQQAAIAAAALQHAQQGGALGHVVAAAAAVMRADGLRGFYTGLAPNMLQVLPSAALSYWTYESAKALLGVA